MRSGMCSTRSSKSRRRATADATGYPDLECDIAPQEPRAPEPGDSVREPSCAGDRAGHRTARTVCGCERDLAHRALRTPAPVAHDFVREADSASVSEVV